MYQEILVNSEAQEKRVAILEDRRLEEFYVERQNGQRLVGNIYKGIVETIVPAIGAAFVKLGLERNGFLYIHDLTRPDYEKMAELIDKPFYGTAASNQNHSEHREPVDIKQMLKVGQEILVQVVKEPLGRKGPRLTTHISLPGRYLVLMPQDGHLGISRRIENDRERIRLKDLLKDLKIPQDMGLIVRTAGSGMRKKECLQDLRYLSSLWRKIKLSFQKARAPALIHEEYDLILRIIRDKLSSQTNKLLVDAKEEYRRITRFLHIVSPSLKSRIQYYNLDLPLFEKKGVEDQIANIYDRKVLLKSGGYIMIEPTEALIAIDVNSGKFTSKRDPEETAYLVNLEAAREIARQIRLRDIGGIIIIDFIDMKLPKHRHRIVEILNEALKRDHAKTDISRISELGLIEMTRQRARKSLERVVYQSCPYCQGKGLVKSPATMAISALRRVKKILQKTNKTAILVFAHPDVAYHLLNENRQSIYALERLFKTKVLVRQDSRLHKEELKIEPA